MKKLILSILLILCLPFQASAWHPMVVVSGTIEEASPCPPFYADSGVVWSWDGQHTSGHNFGCFANGTADEADTDAATTGTDYGEGGADIGILIADSSDYLAWEVMGAVIDQDGPQTMCVKAKISATIVGVNVLLARMENGNDAMRLFIKVDDIVGGFLTTDDPDAYTGEPNLYTAGGWQTYAYSWKDCCTDGDHWAEADTNDDEDLDELDTAQTNTIAEFTLGNLGMSAPDGGKTVHITKAALVTGYQVDCSALTGW